MSRRHKSVLDRRTAPFTGFRAAALFVAAALGLSSQTSSARADIPADIVLYASDAASIEGTWQTVTDSSAAGGQRLWHPDAGAAKPAGASAAPRDFFELTFHAESGLPYRLWLRGKAQSNSYSNDSVFVQFSGSVTADGAPTYRIGSTNSTTLVLENCSGCGVSGWGWQDDEYGGIALGPEIHFAATGPQTLRVQGREDGISVDQIVLSSATYFTTRPGASKNDKTILPKTAATPPNAAGPVSFTWVNLAVGATLDVAATVDLNGDGRMDVVGIYDNAPITIYSFLNNGDRTFRNAQYEELGSGPDSVLTMAVQDFTRDGRKDLLFLNRSNDDMVMMPGRGDGTFGDGIFTSFAEQVEDFGVADFNNDGIPDIVVIEPQNSAAVIHLGDGAGRFSFVSFGRTAPNPTQIVTGDLDNDGLTDVATISKSGNTLSLLYGDGTGRFRATRNDLLPGFAPRAIALGDLNADHRTDIAVTIGTGVRVFLREADGGWEPRDVDTTRTWTGSGLDRDLALGDVNGDSIPDLVTGHVHNPGQGNGVWTSAAVLYGDGTGNFGVPDEFRASGIAPLRVADLDGDSRTDILDTSSGSVFWGAPFTPNRPPTADAGPDVTIGETQQVTLALRSLSTDPDAHLLTYSWTDGNGEEISRGPRVLPFQYVRQPPGSYTFTLTVDDLHGERRSDSVTVTLRSEQTGSNSPPVARAVASMNGVWGYEQQFQDMPDPNTYLFSESTDPDGDALGYEWRDSAGMIVSRTSGLTPQLPPGTHTFTLIVRDGHGGESQDTVTVTVRPFEEIVIGSGYKESVTGTKWERVEATDGSNFAFIVRDIDAGAPKVNAPLASPSSYVEFTFPADPTLEYKLWMRLKAKDDHWANDSLWVQFTGSVDAAGKPAWRTGTTSGLWVNLEECSGCGLSGWGWRDDGWGTAGAMSGTLVRFPQGGLQTIRIQTREDGVSVGQIVLSARRYKSTRPGAVKNDTTVLPATAFWGS